MNPTHGGEVWDYGLKPIDFSSNSNPLGPSREALKALQSWKVEYYPPPYCPELKAEIARYIGVKEKNISVGNGSMELIKDFCCTFLGKSDSTVIPEPTFSEYERYSRVFGRAAKQVLPEVEFKHSAMEIIRAIGHDTKMIFLCRPNNPTGAAMPEEEVMEVLELAQREGIMVFLDEAFIEFSKLNSFAHLVDDYSNLFVLRSFTKFFAIPGLRVGYGVGSPEIIKRLEEIKAPWTVNTFAHDAAIASLRDNAFIKRSRRFILKEKKSLEREIKKLGVNVFESEANFLLMRHNWNSKEVKKELLEEGLLIRDCSSFYGLDARFIRVCVRTRKDNKRMTEALGKQAFIGVKKGVDCSYFPCHFQGQDCTFCYCPLYPCGDEKLGRLIVGKKGKNVWTCKDCGWIHEPMNVEKIHTILGDMRIEDLDEKMRRKIKDAVI
jgi:histidinol-phosphate aminotransferase